MKKQIIVLFCAVAGFVTAQARTITGTVVDNFGDPIIGASIVEKGTTNGTVTDIDGKFSINVEGDALVASFIGYETQELDVSSTSSVDVMLNDESIEIDQIVVVGYGQQKKESVVGAISQVSSKELMQSPAANISQAIAGKIPGVITSQTSGAPGSDDTQIYIRGRATFAGDAQPLVLVDGVEREFSQIAPDDIETISVLKDASATAVYGVRGANGVMLITTKRGRQQEPEVNVSANVQWQAPTRRDTYLNSYESVKLLEEALANDGLPSQFSAEDLEMYKKSCEGKLNGTDEWLYPNVDWYHEALKRWAVSQRYTASVRGATKRLKYYVSGEYYNQKGLVRELSLDDYGNSSSPAFNRYAFRANLDFLMTKALTFAVNFGTRFEERKGPNTYEVSDYSEIFYQLNHTPGWLFPTKYTVDEKTLYGGSSQYQANIIGTLERGGYYRIVDVISETNFDLRYQITKGLSARAMMSFDYDSYDQSNYSRAVANYELNDKTQPLNIDSYTKFNDDGVLGVSPVTSTIWKLYFEAQVAYDRSFGKHDVTAMILYNQNDYRENSELAKRYQGLVGRATYGYDMKYLFEFNIGYNGSENFKKGQRFGCFPAFSVGWVPSREAFLDGASNWLNNLKIRASYGEVGNDVYTVDGVSQRFLYEEKWSQLSGDYYFGTTGYTGVYEQQYPNSSVTWERAHKYNIGLEIGLFNGMLNANLDLFLEKRNDILTEYLTRPEWVGVTMAAGNIGETKNQGYEIELHHAYHIGNDFNYTVGFTWSHARNEITFMDEPALKTDYRKQEGHAISQYFGLVCEGFVTEADIKSGNLPISTFAQSDLQPGDLKYKDMNGDGYIDDRDQCAIGYSDLPENTWTASLGANWKGIGFSIMFQGVSNVSKYYDAEAMFAFVSGGKVKEHHQERWDPTASESSNLKNAKYPLLHYDEYGDHNQRQNSFFLQNGNFGRLKNIELSYTLPERISKKAAMSELRIYVNGNNLATWDKLKYDKLVDPESNGSNRYPIMKTWNVGLNIKF